MNWSSAKGGSVISVNELAELLDVIMIPFIENRTNILSNSKYSRIKEFLDRTKILKDYLRSMLGDNMTYELYYQIRARYKDEIIRLQGMVAPYLASQNAAGAEISNAIRQIESKEILRMFGGDTLRDNYNSITTLGFLSNYQ